jgi:hypothetical protein
MTGWPKGKKRSLEQRAKDVLGFALHNTAECLCIACRSVRDNPNGDKNGMFGKKHTDVARHNMSVNHQGKTVWNKGLTKEVDIRLAKLANTKKNQWKDIEFAKMMLHRRTPSGPEQSFIKLCKEFKYVGNGTLVIDGKNPDFVDSTGKKLVEIWGDYFHKGQNPQDRIDFFKTCGYDCIVIWASELKHPEQVVRKVQNGY